MQAVAQTTPQILLDLGEEGGGAYLRSRLSMNHRASRLIGLPRNMVPWAPCLFTTKSNIQAPKGSIKQGSTAALKRCATQKQGQRRVFSATSEAAPFQNKLKLRDYEAGWAGDGRGSGSLRV